MTNNVSIGDFLEGVEPNINQLYIQDIWDLSDEEIDRQEIARLAAEVSAEIDAAIAAIDAMSAPDVVVAPLALTDSESVGDWAPQTDVRTRGGVSGSGKGSDVSGGDEGAGGNAWASAEPATMMQRK